MFDAPTNLPSSQNLNPGSRRPKPVVVIAAIVGVLIAAGAIYYGLVYFRAKSILTDNTALNQAITNIEVAADQIDLQAVDQGNDQAVKQLAEVYSTDSETVRTAVQFTHIAYLYAVLNDYSGLYGAYPTTLDALVASWQDIVDACRIQPGCHIKNITKQTATDFVYDVFTQAPYVYELQAPSYTLTYRMGHCKDQQLCDDGQGYYRNGINTMSAEDISLEQKHASDAAGGANTSTLIPLDRDTDGDGLTDVEELYVYKTDSTKTDTDGDGFTDGQEVSNGYDPNGPGQLPNR